MKLLLLFGYFLLLNGLMVADGTSGATSQHILRLSTGIDFGTNHTSVYLLFTAICLYGICVICETNAVYKMLQLHNFVAIRISRKRYTIVFYKRIIAVALMIFSTKLAADIVVLLLYNEVSFVTISIAVKLSFLIFIAASMVGCLVYGLLILDTKPAITIFISFIMIIIVIVLNDFSIIAGIIFAPVPKSFIVSDIAIILTKIAELIAVFTLVYVISRNRYWNISFIGGRHDKD